jgi:RNA polymerase primary sigma factor
MPRIANATSVGASTIGASALADEATSSRVDDLIQRGRSQGHLSLSDLRTAFEQAGLTPTEARSILRELSESGVRLANEEPELLAPKPARKAATGSKGSTAKASPGSPASTAKAAPVGTLRRPLRPRPR